MKYSRIAELTTAVILELISLYAVFSLTRYSLDFAYCAEISWVENASHFESAK